MSSKLTKKKRSIPVPLPVVKKRAVLTFQDTENGQFAFDLIYEPDGFGDPTSMAHVFACKCKGFLDLVLDKFPTPVSTESALSTNKPGASDEMDAQSNILTKPRLVQ